MSSPCETNSTPIIAQDNQIPQPNTLPPISSVTAFDLPVTPFVKPLATPIVKTNIGSGRGRPKGTNKKALAERGQQLQELALKVIDLKQKRMENGNKRPIFAKTAPDNSLQEPSSVIPIATSSGKFEKIKLFNKLMFFIFYQVLLPLNFL